MKNRNSRNRNRNIKDVVLKCERHQRAAMPLHMSIIIINGILALGCIGGGTYAVAVNSVSQTEINILGMKVSTGSVGVAFIAIGLIIAYRTVKSVLKNQYDLAALPPDYSNLRKVEEVLSPDYSDYPNLINIEDENIEENKNPKRKRKKNREQN